MRKYGKNVVSAHYVIIAFLLTLLLLISRPLSAATLEEIDKQLQTADSPAEMLKATTVIQESLEQTPSSSDLIWRLAKSYYKLGTEAGRATRKEYFISCIEQAKRAIQLNSQSAGGFFFKGVCEGKLGEVDGVWSSLGVIEPLKQNMETVIKIDPAFEQGGPHRALGKMYHELPLVLGGSLDKALEHLKEAVRLGPQFAENYFLLAETYYSRKEYQPAQAALNTVLDMTKEAKIHRDIRLVRRDAQELLKKITRNLGDSNAQGTQNP